MKLSFLQAKKYVTSSPKWGTTQSQQYLYPLLSVRIIPVTEYLLPKD